MNPKYKSLLEVAEAVKLAAGVKTHVVLPDVIMERSESFLKHGIILAPKGSTDIGLAILAHEAGHIATTKALEKHHPNVVLTEVEFEASRWGFEHIRKSGGKTTEAMEQSAREALKSYAVDDFMNRTAPPSKAAVAFLNGLISI